MKPRLTDVDLCRNAQRVGCGVAEIRTFLAVETRGKGFDDQDRPVILFERHWFHRFTNGVYDKSHPNISNPVAGGYGPSSSQYDRFSQAFALDAQAAMKSASWGIGQVMGFNHVVCGYSTVDAFVDAMKQSEGKQLDAAIDYVVHVGLADELRGHKWAQFAAGYNGPKYKENNYDTKLKAEYDKFKTETYNCTQILNSAPASQPPAVSEPSDTVDKTDSSPQSQAPTTTTTTTSVTVTDDNVQGQETATTSRNVAVGKEDHPSFIQYMWKKVTGAIAAVGGWATITQGAQQAQVFGFPATFWQSVFIIVAIIVAAWILIEAIKWFFVVVMKRWRTQKLAELNSTPNNTVIIVPQDQLDQYEKQGWVVIRRNQNASQA